MKQVKRLIGLFMCVAVATGCLTGCGGKSDATILTSSVKSINSAKNFDMSMKTSGKIKGSMMDESIDFDMDEDIDEETKGTLFADPLKVKYITTTSEASHTSEQYLQKEGDKFFCYTNLGERWVKYSVDEDTAMGGVNFMQKLLPEDASKYTKKDDIEENGKKYLTYECPVAEDFIKNMIRSLTSSTESMMQDEDEEEAKMVDDAIKSIGDIKMTILIDRETETIYQIRCPLGAILKEMMDSLMKSADEEELYAMEFETIDIDAVITYSNVGTAADFEMPEAEEVDLSGDSEDEE